MLDRKFLKGKPLKLNQIFWAKPVASGYRHLPWKPGVREERFSVQDIAQTYLKHGGKNYTNDRWHFNVPVRLASRLRSKDLKSLKRIRKVNNNFRYIYPLFMAWSLCALDNLAIKILKWSNCCNVKFWGNRSLDGAAWQGVEFNYTSWTSLRRMKQICLIWTF